MNDSAARVRHHRHESHNRQALGRPRDEKTRCGIRLTGVACALVLLTACGGERTGTSPTVPTAVLPTRPASPLPNGFQISFSADPACTMLPAAARTRTYSASVGVNGIELGNATFGGDGSYSWHILYATFAEDAAHLYFQDPPVWERLTADEYVVIYGIEAAGTVRDLPATLSFPGRFTFCAESESDPYPECAVPEIVCTSTKHTLTINRQ